ncbi:MAG TPA: MotA/TolQ/ExbB proton channel family protein [Planctomycetaceae bacterium]|nr:MotA/TolQ/ExbB proton channel family protein [Planctomycetaceae bacterium]
MTARKQNSGSHSGIAASPLLWAGVLCFVFYRLIPVLPRYRELAERYFCGHPLEYATAYLFFVGMTVLAMKSIRGATERDALQVDLFEGVTESGAAALQQLESNLNAAPERFQTTQYLTRLRECVKYLTQQKSSESIEEHLRYLADRDAERTHESYALVRTVTWAVPILGFLGTVVGITMAIANIEFSQLKDSMGDVVAGLSVSFDTTALALTLSMLLVFASFLVERMEMKILNEIEDKGLEEIAIRFASARETKSSPLAAAELAASEELLENTREMIAWQTDLWKKSVEGMRAAWLESLHQQQSELTRSIAESIQTSLAHHELSVEQAQSEFLGAFRGIAELLETLVEENRDSQIRIREESESSVLRIHQASEDGTRELNAHVRSLSSELMHELQTWQRQLRDSTDSTGSQLDEIRKQTELLSKLCEQELSLTSLTDRLAINIKTISDGNKLEELLHNLNAAIHLMTARTLPRAG